MTRDITSQKVGNNVAIFNNPNATHYGIRRTKNWALDTLYDGNTYEAKFWLNRLLALRLALARK